MSAALQAAADRLQHWITREAIPLWLRLGFSPETGAHYERLTPFGEVDREASLRMRVQARQMFFYAQAYDRGWCDQGRAAAEGMLAFVRAKAAHPSAAAGYVHLLTADHQHQDIRQDLYDHAFFLLALAWIYRAFGNKSALEEAEALVAHLDTRFGSAVGGWIEGDYDYACRRQNPHMHLFEAFLALYDATGDSRWLARVGELFALFQTRFFDSQRGVLFEFFNEDWTRLADQRGEVVEPGHMMEWVWLLDWYSRRSGRPVSQYTRVLYERGLALGMAPSGLLYDAVAADGRVLDSGKRCWGMTELIKASLVQIRAGHPRAEAIAVKAVDDLFTYYLCAPVPGSYVDRRGAEDQVIAAEAPASSLYHLIVAAVELVDHCRGV